MTDIAVWALIVAIVLGWAFHWAAVLRHAYWVRRYEEAFRAWEDRDEWHKAVRSAMRRHDTDPTTPEEP